MAKHELYHIWWAMKQRCSDPSNAEYKNYGGRGIGVCDSWEDSFDNFLRDMGNRPSPDHSLDRIDNDGDYCPGNCRWATREEQNRNKRTNRRITLDGECLILEDWAKRLKISPGTLLWRLQNWSLKDALTTPKHNRGPKTNPNQETPMEEYVVQFVLIEEIVVKTTDDINAVREGYDSLLHESPSHKGKVIAYKVLGDEDEDGALNENPILSKQAISLFDSFHEEDFRG